jgi:hypothetical protein
MDNYKLLLSGILVGITNCLIVYPFDSIKT